MAGGTESGGHAASQRPMGGLVPPSVTGSPSDLPDQPRGALQPEFATIIDGDVPWWRPGAWDVARAIGWWWALLAPLLLLGLGLLAGLFTGFLRWSVFAGLIKLIVLCFGGAVSIIGYGIRNVVKARHESFCIHCGYTLDGLADVGTCPECGRPYQRALIDEFRKDPHFFAHRYKKSRELPARMTPFLAGDGPTANDGTR